MSVEATIPDAVIPATRGAAKDGRALRSEESGNPVAFPRYPKYKDSGVEWLGEVPTHWDVVRVKHALDRMGAGGTPDTSNARYWADEGGVAWVAIGDMSDRDTVSATAKRVSAEGIGSKDLIVWPPGTLLFSMYASLGHVAELAIPAATNQAILALLPQANMDQSFLKRWFEHIRPSLRQEASSNTQDNLNAEKVRNLPAIVPSKREQIAIASFLDRETGKIDALIAEQEKLIALLKEKRQALISRAVTKGLDTNAPMKDSGIEWLGQVPAHWRIVRNKAIFQELDDRSETDAGELLTVSHITGVTKRSEKNVNMILAETLEGYKKCAAGDLVINTMWAWMGALGVSPLDGLVSPSYNVYGVRDRQQLHGGYYDYLCRIHTHIVLIKAHSTGIWESRLRLYPDTFLAMHTCLPPLEEQRAIAEYLDRATRRLDQLTTEAEYGITLLKERRGALISAAVTGKIDVRYKANSE